MICNKLSTFVFLAACVALADGLSSLSSTGPNAKCAHEAYTEWWSNTWTPRPKDVNAAGCYNSAQGAEVYPLNSYGGIVLSPAKHYCYDGVNRQNRQPEGYDCFFLYGSTKLILHGNTDADHLNFWYNEHVCNWQAAEKTLICIIDDGNPVEPEPSDPISPELIPGN